MFGWIALGFVPMLSALEIYTRKMASHGKDKTIDLETHTRGGSIFIGL